jgi:hypothetical protein
MPFVGIPIAPNPKTLFLVIPTSPDERELVQTQHPKILNHTSKFNPALYTEVTN